MAVEENSCQQGQDEAEEEDKWKHWKIIVATLLLKIFQVF